MATPVSNAVGLTGDARADGLTQGSAWQFGGGPRVITYSISLNDTGVGGPWTADFAAAVRSAFFDWAAVANISFVEQGSGYFFPQSSADIAITLTGNELADIGGLALAFFPHPGLADEFLDGSPDYSRSNYANPEGDIFFDNFNEVYNNASAVQNLSYGHVGYSIILHQIGLALGLKHPFDDGRAGRPTFEALGIGAYDTTDFTVMTELDLAPGPGRAYYPSTPMALDVYAIQRIYGANMSYRAGNDLYNFGDPATVGVDVSLYQMITVWDAGGVDTFDVSSISAPVVDLRPGHFSSIGSATVGIAYGVTIERVVGSGYHEHIIGNDAANHIVTGSGFTGAPPDTLEGGDGDDTYVLEVDALVIERADDGVDTVESWLPTFTLGDHIENLHIVANLGGEGHGNNLGNTMLGNQLANGLFGAGGNDTLNGDNGDDRLDGGTGVDDMSGGAGNDIYIVNTSSDTAVESVGEGIDRVEASAGFTLQVNVENLTLTGSGNVNGIGNTLANMLTGNGGNNRLTGNEGNDTLAGAAGNDTLLGGAGNDSLDGGAGTDSLDGGAGIDSMSGGDGGDVYLVNSSSDVTVEGDTGDTDVVQSTAGYTLRAFFENLTLTGNGNVNGIGNTQANILTGNGANNRLTGMDGNDTLAGAAGNDTLRGYADNDSLDGGTGNDSLDGGGGTDTMAGGAGSDLYLVNSSTDVIVETGAGVDLVQSTSGHTLRDNVENLTLTGNGNTNGIGNILANTVTGNGGTNQLRGMDGNDTLEGGAGNDVLIGGAGTDRYTFATALGGTNIDRITDFDPAGELLRLDDLVFTGLAAGTLGSGAFRSGAQAGDANDRIIYDPATGAVFFDADGTGTGDAVQFATLGLGLAITANDFVVV